LTVDVVLTVGVLLVVGDEDAAADCQDPERGEPARELAVDEGTRSAEQPGAAVEHVHAAVAEVGREQAVAAARQPLVDRVRG
jgi:hypothetical protein